jgi:hypothetical protein
VRKTRDFPCFLTHGRRLVPSSHGGSHRFESCAAQSSYDNSSDALARYSKLASKRRTTEDELARRATSAVISSSAALGKHTASLDFPVGLFGRAALM